MADYSSRESAYSLLTLSYTSPFSPANGQHEQGSLTQDPQYTPYPLPRCPVWVIRHNTATANIIHAPHPLPPLPRIPTSPKTYRA